METGAVKAAFEAWVQEEQDKGAHSEMVRAKRMVGREFQESCKVKMLGGCHPSGLPPVLQRSPQGAR
jgi:hypothetical protein